MRTAWKILAASAVQLISVGAIAQGSAEQAGAYPVRPIRLVIPYAAGGVSDIMGRVLGQKMAELLGQPVVVDNRGGAGGTLGTEIVAKAAPDGYTMVLSSLATLAIGPNMVKNVAYDPIRDFSAIGGVATTPNILTVNAAAPFQSLKELVSYAKANPGKLSFGSSGVGSIGHLSGEILRTSVGAEMVHVPYKSAGLAYPDMFSGSVSMVFDTLPSAIQHIRSGRAKPIAVLSDKRSPLLPEVPTFAEAGFPKSTLRFWFGLHGPANMRPAIVQKLNDTLTKALASSDLRERFSVLGAEPFPISPRELVELTRNDVSRLAQTMKAAGIKPE